MSKGSRNHNNNNKSGGSSSNGNGDTTNKKKKKRGNGRRRGRDEIGVGGANNAIRIWDEEQRRDEQMKYFPSFEEIEKHWRIDPDDSEGKRLMCNKEDGTWKVVVPEEEIYDTCMNEIKTGRFGTFGAFKKFMTGKYYIDESILDCLIADPHDPDDPDKNIDDIKIEIKRTDDEVDDEA